LEKYKSIKTKAAYEKQTEHKATLSSKPFFLTFFFFVIKECLHGQVAAEEYIT
jgi:hypothetical protein